MFLNYEEKILNQPSMKTINIGACLFSPLCILNIFENRLYMTFGELPSLNINIYAFLYWYKGIPNTMELERQQHRKVSPRWIPCPTLSQSLSPPPADSHFIFFTEDALKCWYSPMFYPQATALHTLHTLLGQCHPVHRFELPPVN